MLTAINAAAVLALTPKLQVDTVGTLSRAIPVLVVSELINSFIGTNDVFSSFLATVLTGLLTPLIAIMFVLLGAPATDYIPETLLCSGFVTLLAIQPMVARYGIEYAFWKQAFSLELPLTEVYGGFLGGIFGAWLGAIPIALDWDRPWQKWPITILIGAATGTLVGNLLGLVFSSGKQDKYGLDKQRKLDKKAEKRQRERAEKLQKNQQS